MENVYKSDVIIIGAGPAGMSAAIYLLRAGVNCTLIEREAPGGNLNKTHKIDNYPGYVEHAGTTLAFKMYEQLEELGIDLKIENVVKVIKEENSIIVKTNNNEYQAKYLIIATGRSPKKLSNSNLLKLEGNGISYCAICDGALYKDKNVIVVGGGNSAMENALYLSDIAKTVTIINRSDKLRATKKEQDDVMSKNNIKIVKNFAIKDVLLENDKVIGVKSLKDDIIHCDGIFVAIGQELNNDFYKDLNIKTDDKGIIVNELMQTNDDKVFAVGDAVSKYLYQVVTATSEGAVAATKIISQLRFSKE